MPGAEDKPEKQHRSDSQDAGVADLEEVLRQIGNDILHEDVPERLRRVLRPKDGSDDASATDGSRDHPPRRGGAQRRDGEPSA
jgi:hypothetical protein